MVFLCVSFSLLYDFAFVLHPAPCDFCPPLNLFNIRLCCLSLTFCLLFSGFQVLFDVINSMKLMFLKFEQVSRITSSTKRSSFLSLECCVLLSPLQRRWFPHWLNVYSPPTTGPEFIFSICLNCIFRLGISSGKLNHLKSHYWAPHGC